MNNPTQRSIKWLSVAILIFATIYFGFIYAKTINQLWIQKTIVWNQDKLAWQVFIIAGRLIATALLYFFCWIFLVRTNRSLKNGEIFPRSNVSLLRWAALVTALATFVQSNYGDAIKGAQMSVLDGNTLFYPLVVLFFAGLYKIAYLTAKDSSLAI
jgi:hypothetical protein